MVEVASGAERQPVEYSLNNHRNIWLFEIKFVHLQQINKECITMATITLSNAAYNDAKQYAETQNLSVDEFIVSLINKFGLSKAKKKKFNVQPIEKLAPEVQEILNLPIKGTIDPDDINAEEARMDYYKEKYGL